MNAGSGRARGPANRLPRGGEGDDANAEERFELSSATPTLDTVIVDARHRPAPDVDAWQREQGQHRSPNARSAWQGCNADAAS